MPRTRAAVLVSLIIALFTAPLTASAAPPPTPSRTSGNAIFGIGAGNSKGLDGRPYVRFYASPGAVTQDHVVLRNIGSTPLKINVYAAAAKIGENGAVGFTDRTATPTGEAAWLKVITPKDQGFVIVPGKGQAILPIALKVPMSASPGDHTLAVIASIISRVKGKSGQNLNFEQRVALRTFVRVSGDLNPSLEIRNISVQYSAASIFTGRGRAVIHYVIHNDGNLNLGGRSAVRVTGPLGSTGSVAVTPPDAPLLLPGASVSGQVVVNDVLAQMWMSAKVTVTPLKPLGDNDPPMRAISATAEFVAVPWLVLIMVVALIGVVLVVFLWRRRRNRPRGDVPTTNTLPVDDDIIGQQVPEEVAS